MIVIKDLEVRQMETELNSNENILEGYALKFNSLSNVMRSGKIHFREIISPGALENADLSNVVAYFNHDKNQVIGRLGANMQLETDNIGLRFKIDLPDTQLSRDLKAQISSGIINQCSFGFTLGDNATKWEKSTEDGVDYVRTINQFKVIRDVSVVTNPAYPDTEVHVRSMPDNDNFAKEKFELQKQALLDF